MNCVTYYLLPCRVREVITTICPLCHPDCTGTGRNGEETNYLFASQSECGASAMNL